MTSQPWFRFYSETLDDLKLDRAAALTGQPKVVILGVWVGILALGNSSPIRGQLLLCEGMPMVSSEMAKKIGVDDKTMIDVINTFMSLKMVHWVDTEGTNQPTLTITNMHKRQFESDNSTRRVKAHRERKKEQEKPSDETPDSQDSETLQKRSCNTPDTEPETDTKSETDKDSPPSADAIAQTPPPTPEKAPKSPSKPKPPPLTDGAKEFLRLFSAKRFSNAAQRSAILELERQFPVNFLPAATWAAEKGVARGQAIAMMRKALPNWGKKQARTKPKSNLDESLDGINQWLEGRRVNVDRVP